MKKPSIQEFKAWSREHYSLAHAVAMAQAYAQIKREQVDAYIKPVFDMFDFYVKPEWSRDGKPERITDPERLYLSDQEELVAQYFEECDREHRKHGFTGKHGHCPALEAEELQRTAEQALIDAGKAFLGIEDINGPFLENRKKLLDLLMGACLNSRKAA